MTKGICDIQGAFQPAAAFSIVIFKRAFAGPATSRSFEDEGRRFFTQLLYHVDYTNRISIAFARTVRSVRRSRTPA